MVAINSKIAALDRPATRALAENVAIFCCSTNSFGPAPMLRTLGLSESEIATSGAIGSQVVFPSVVSTIVTPWLPMINSETVSPITATLNPRGARNSVSLSARIG